MADKSLCRAAVYQGTTSGRQALGRDPDMAYCRGGIVDEDVAD